MSGNDTANIAEASTPSVSVLERFRQLSREKEKQQLEATSSLQGPVRAVYLNNDSVTSEKSGGDDDTQKSIPNDECKVLYEQGRKRYYNDKRIHEDKQSYVDNKKKKVVYQGLHEEDVGITEYINNSNKGFHGIIKQRFSDFQVNEIDIDGNIVKLTSLELPPEPPEKELSEEINGTLTNEDWEKISEIYENKLEGKVFSIDVTDMEKSKRHRIHKDVKNKFGVNMFSNTVDKDGRKVIEIGYKSDNKERTRWPSNRGDYLHFVVHKENAETTETIHMLSYKLRMKPNYFSYAGTKDKRGVTSQLMSVRKTRAERLLALGTMRGVKLGNFVYKNKSLRLGHLKGNHFRIAIRCIDADDEVIQATVSSLKETGFINYFGLQRFGVSRTVPTYVVGKAMLQDNFKQAVELILKPRPGERTHLDVEQAREIWWKTRDARSSLRCLQRCEKSIEGKVLQSLAKIGPNAYVNAFESLPRNSVMLYLHSYQSRLWNIIVSRRINKYGLKPLPGDLVLQNPDDEKDILETDKANLEYNGDYTGDDSENKGQAENIEEAVCGTKLVRKLNQSEVDTVSIEKVVYPLLGYDVELPDNEIAEWYTDLLKEDGLAVDMFKKSNKLFSTSGSYRRMISKPWDVQWHTVRYFEQNADLILSDADEMSGKPCIESIPDGQYKALVLEFSLKPSVYATMALRELLKCETSAGHQAFLTQQQTMAAEKEKEQTENNQIDETNADNCKLNSKMELD